MLALIPFLLALARTVPAIDDLFRQIVALRDQDQAKQARQRLADKDSAVDAAIDGPANPPK